MRSLDTIEIKSVGWVCGTGNSNTLKNYSFEDGNALAGLTQGIYVPELMIPGNQYITRLL